MEYKVMWAKYLQVLYVRTKAKCLPTLSTHRHRMLMKSRTLLGKPTKDGRFDVNTAMMRQACHVKVLRHLRRTCVNCTNQEKGTRGINHASAYNSLA